MFKTKLRNSSESDSDDKSSSDEKSPEKPVIKNPWSSCIQDELISNSLNSLSHTDQNNIQRGVETYYREKSQFLTKNRYYYDGESLN